MSNERLTTKDDIMSKIIEELFNGNICPNGGTYAQDSPYVHAAGLKKRNYDMKLQAMHPMKYTCRTISCRN